MINHIDLFSGIGGFSLAAEMVWGKNINHTFVEYDLYCQEVLKKLWPGAELHGDIGQFIADTKRERQLSQEGAGQERQWPVDLITGGFPCQPFSQAGRRKGTDDERYKWPEMFACIGLFRPQWIVAENVAGLATWNDGLVLETVCSDMESEGYEVQPFIIPACAVEAPHRRDRVWIIAHTKHERTGYTKRRGDDKRASAGTSGSDPYAANARHTESPGRNEASKGQQHGRRRIPQRLSSSQNRGDDADTGNAGLERRQQAGARYSGFSDRAWSDEGAIWRDQNWPEVASRLCRVDAGIPARLDRTPRLKALGNSICPPVAAEIFRSIAIAGI